MHHNSLCYSSVSSIMAALQWQRRLHSEALTIIMMSRVSSQQPMTIRAISRLRLQAQQQLSAHLLSAQQKLTAAWSQYLDLSMAKQRLQWHL